ncbi:hypothetical protein H4N54_01725 [Limnospira fusiformis KN01]|uniref:hypothetical protein n=1 Tax=Limnospira TaxID=2596745 RepID=UPI001658B7E7|nr:MULTISPECIES: hypothetical protein [Limnospira]MDT9197907.1 hypothetical protein [Limnospira sp. PMC 1042.18]MDT9235144.1 hypothetical protein [Limnospira sp. PMC 917.15]ULB46146.1 hypothetical protein H4N54_01725 [Limnospira fusiformis KN01]
MNEDNILEKEMEKLALTELNYLEGIFSCTVFLTYEVTLSIYNLTNPKLVRSLKFYSHTLDFTIPILSNIMLNCSAIQKQILLCFNNKDNLEFFIIHLHQKTIEIFNRKDKKYSIKKKLTGGIISNNIDNFLVKNSSEIVILGGLILLFLMLLINGGL